MSDNDAMLELLRDQEKTAEREYHEAKADADRMVAVADARLTMIRELIEKATTKKRGRPKKAETSTPTTETAEPPMFSREDPY